MHNLYIAGHLLDNTELPNVSLKFLLSKTTSQFQSCDYGIFDSLKQNIDHYLCNLCSIRLKMTMK